VQGSAAGRDQTRCRFRARLRRGCLHKWTDRLLGVET
jgi:hypothetical protein